MKNNGALQTHLHCKKIFVILTIPFVILATCILVACFQIMVLYIHPLRVQHSTFHKSFKLPSICVQFIHVGLKLSHGSTAVVCWTANSTVHVCNTQTDHTECVPSIQPPNPSYRPRFLQGDHHGNTNQNLHLAAVYCNNPDRNQCAGEKSKCLSWDCDWAV